MAEIRRRAECLEHESDDGASYSAAIDGDFLVKQSIE
jgi:hypothetical protein